MKIYSIAGWAKHFEVYDAKRVDGPLKWVAVPTKTDGFGFSRIRKERDRCELLAAWYLLLGVAAKQPKADRGKLARDGVPLTPEDLELMTGFPARVFSRALEFYSQPAQGWLVAEDLPIDATSMQHPSAPIDPTGQDRTGHYRTGVGPSGSAQRRAAVAAPTSDAEWLAELGSNPAYAGINVGAEYGKMQAWCGANRKQPTRRRFVAWLNRCERPMAAQLTIRPQPQQTEPANWRATLKRLYPDASEGLAWAALPQSVRDAILAAS